MKRTIALPGGARDDILRIISAVISGPTVAVRDPFDEEETH